MEPTGRLVVRLDDDSLKNVKPENLVPANIIRKQPHTRICAAAFVAWKDTVDHVAIADAASKAVLAPVRERPVSALDLAKKRHLCIPPLLRRLRTRLTVKTTC